MTVLPSVTASRGRLGALLFLAKVFLRLRGCIPFDLWANLAVAGILSEVIGRSGFDLTESDIRQLADRAPSTPFVAENNGALVVRNGDRDMAKGRSFGMGWVELPAGGTRQGS